MKSKVLFGFFLNDEVSMKLNFVVDDSKTEYKDDDCDYNDKIEFEDDECEYDDEVEIYDNVCAICDNGDIYNNKICLDRMYCSCEGKCLRAFHATNKSAKSAKSYCKSLNLPVEEVEGSQPFICLNCSHERHQCFVCKKLGSSNKSSGAEVFCCILATCGHFYHPRCVAQLLKDENDTEAHDLEENIAAGESFTCPAHKCHKCKQEENEKVKGLQFAVCRRCPKSYHIKCLPRKIMFNSEDNDEDVITRAWDDLLPKSRALIFCLKHKMDNRLHTAKRNIKFPEIDDSKKSKEAVNSDCISDERKVKKFSSRKRARMTSRSESIKKRLKKNLPVNVKRDSKKDHIPVDEDQQTPTATPMESEDESFTSLDADSRERILMLVKEVDSSVTMDNVKRQNIGNLPSAQASLPKVEESMELEEGCSIEDAMADCEPGDLDQLWKLKDKLRVYLAPFLDKTLHTKVDNCELNCEVSMETVEKEVASVISQKETSQHDNNKTRTEEKVDGQKEKHKSCLPPASEIRQSDFKISSSNYNNCGYGTKRGREYFSSQRNGYVGSQRDSGFSSKYILADPSTYTRPSISVIQRYAPKLDELNHTRMNNMKTWVYTEASGFDPRPYRPSEHLNSTAGWLEE